MLNSLNSLIQTGIHATNPKNNEINAEETRHQCPPLFLERQKHPFLVSLPPHLSPYPSKNTRAYFEPRNSPTYQPSQRRTKRLHAACSALPIGRRDARAFSVAGARDPTPAPATKARLLLAG